MVADILEEVVAVAVEATLVVEAAAEEEVALMELLNPEGVVGRSWIRQRKQILLDPSPPVRVVVAEVDTQVGVVEDLPEDMEDKIRTK